jgi:hypothetical protein
MLCTAKYRRGVKPWQLLSGASGKNRHQVQQVHKPDREPDLPNMGVAPRLSPEQIDRLCREILDPPAEE